MLDYRSVSIFVFTMNLYLQDIYPLSWSVFFSIAIFLYRSVVSQPPIFKAQSDGEIVTAMKEHRYEGW